MNRLIIGSLCGALAGAVLTYVLLGPDTATAPAEVIRDIVVVEKMSPAIAAEHRQDRYAALQTVEQIYALPSDFARSEALYALAGRADSGGAQSLIFEAKRIADSEDRASALNILFFRLTEIDPESALTLARTSFFRGDRAHERRVWIAWARRDLDEALFAAKTQTTITHSNSAAQSLYVAFGYMGNEITDRIEKELGIAPDRSTRGRFIYRLADESPARAIAFINAMEPGIRQEEFVSWLAFHLSKDDAAYALVFADLFANENYQRNFRALVANNAAKADPKETLDRLIASGGDFQSSGEFYSAIRSLAGTDLEAAMQYFQQVHVPDARRSLGGAIAAEYAKKDPVAALAWARANDDKIMPILQLRVLSEIAVNDPDLAFNEALAAQNAELRSNLMSRVISMVARTDPAIAVRLIDQIENVGDRRNAASNFISDWIRSDPDAAVAWILQNDEATRNELLGNATRMLAHGDLDAAVRILPKLSGTHYQNMRVQVAQRMAKQRSVAEAQSFIRQFEGQDGYPQLQVAVITGLAQSDPVAAKQMADQLPAGQERDAALSQVIRHHAANRPLEALAWSDSIGSEAQRRAATANIASSWYQQDPVAASRWVGNLPRGSRRDDAIMRMASRFRDMTPAEQALIQSIGDSQKRGAVQLNYVRQLMNSNPARARQILSEIEISPNERRRYEQMLDRIQGL